MAVNDASLAQIVGRHFQRDFVAGEDADMVLAHFAARVGDDSVAVIQGDAETGIGQDFGDETAHFNEFSFSHVFSLVSRTVPLSRVRVWSVNAGASGAVALVDASGGPTRREVAVEEAWPLGLLRQRGVYRIARTPVAARTAAQIKRAGARRHCGLG